MKKWILPLVLVTAFSMIPTHQAYAADFAYKETPLDQMWDGFTTLGKQSAEKERILAENKAERLKRYAEKMGKQAEKDSQRAAADAKKKLGF